MQRLTRLSVKACKLDIQCNVAAGVLPSEDDNDDEYKFKMTTDVPLDKVIKGEYTFIFCHPAPLLNTRKGHVHLLLDSVAFQQSILAVVIDECHTVELW